MSQVQGEGGVRLYMQFLLIYRAVSFANIHTTLNFLNGTEIYCKPIALIPGRTFKEYK